MSTTQIATRASTARTGWHRMARVRHLAVAWILAYGTLRLWWVTTGSRPHVPPLGDDLVFLADGGSVALCLAAVALALSAGRPAGIPWLRRGLLFAAWAVSVVLVAISCLFFLDVVAALFPGMGAGLHPVGVVGRAGGLASGVLLGASALVAQRELRGACPACGRRAHAGADHSGTDHPGADEQRSLAPAPRRVITAGYLAVFGCLTRLAAQAAVGFDPVGAALSPGSRSSAEVLGPALFMVCIVAAGTILPLALVHRWGRILPRWVPVVAGRTVPRWLLLGPAFAVAAGLVAYFGTGMALIVIETLQGSSTLPESTLPPLFFWVAVPAYLIWGLGLGAAALSYHQRTRPPCRRCGRGGRASVPAGAVTAQPSTGPSTA
jgi:hypothetical protein